MNNITPRETETNRESPMGQNPDYNPEALIDRLRGKLDDANEMIANLHRALAEAKDARDGWIDEHNRAVDQLIDEKRISDRLVDRLSTLEAELVEAQNTITQMREMLKDALELGLIAHAPGCSGGIRTSTRASDSEYPYPCKCGYVEWLEKLKEVTDGDPEQV